MYLFKFEFETAVKDALPVNPKYGNNCQASRHWIITVCPKYEADSTFKLVRQGQYNQPNTAGPTLTILPPKLSKINFRLKNGESKYFWDFFLYRDVNRALFSLYANF